MTEVKLLPSSYKPILRDEAIKKHPFAEQCRIVFGRVGLLTADSLILPGLQTRTSALDERLEAIYTFSPPSPESVHRRLGYILDENPEEQGVAAEFGELVHELAETTEYFDLMKRDHLVRNLEFGLDDSPLGLRTRYIKPGSMLDRLIKLYPYLEGYYPALGATVLSGEFPHPEEMWVELATTGTLPRPVSQLNKELMVDAQYSKLQHAVLLTPMAARWAIGTAIFATSGFLAERVFSYGTLPLMAKLNSFLTNDPYLSEVYALAACADSPAFDFFELDEKPEIVSSIVEKDYKKREKDCAKIIKAGKAYEFVRSMMLLGVDEAQIADAIRLAGFNRSIGTYPRLERRLAEIREQVGLGDDEHFRQVVLALDFERVIEIAELRMHAMKTADRHLTNTSQGFFKP